MPLSDLDTKMWALDNLIINAVFASRKLIFLVPFFVFSFIELLDIMQIPTGGVFIAYSTEGSLFERHANVEDRKLNGNDKSIWFTCCRPSADQRQDCILG